MKNPIVILFLFILCSSFQVSSQSYDLKNLTGDFYDNRDGNHANMPLTDHPNLTYMSSGYSLQATVIPDTIVFGNASLAYTSGTYWGSLTRVLNLRRPSGMTESYILYTNNNAYWYPEHQDHDDIDHYFTQAPMINNSQGSSGSEIDEMHKWFHTLDAFDSSTKNFLKEQKLLIPTMQLIARRSRVENDEAYLTGVAHPNAFDNADVRGEMEAMAIGMTPGTIPPMVQIETIEEDYNSAHTEENYWLFEPSNTVKENIHETPVTISRVWHGLEYTKRIVVSAENSYDANGLALTYHWAVLRGDSAHITINPLNDNHSRVEILIDYHSETTIPGETRLTNLVSIGAFVHNGHYYSAPAFITSYTKRNEERVYNETSKKIESITYNNNYIDPTISWEKNWDSDVFSYDENGNLTGWIRYEGETQYRFTKEGYIIEEEDANGIPTMVSKVTYNKTGDLNYWQRSGSPFVYVIVGVQDIIEDIDLSIYPNPIQQADFITVKRNNCTDFSPFTIEIYNIKGNLLKTVKANGCEVRVNMNSFSAANYLFKISTLNAKNKKVIKSIMVVKN